MSFSIRLLLISILLAFVTTGAAQTASEAPAPGPSTPPPTSSTPPGGNGTNTSPPHVLPTGSSPPDVLLQVPELHVGRIELGVEKLQADLNLNARVAGLVKVNAGVQVSVEKVNITIADVDVNLELVVRLGNLVSIVERVFDSLDLNPLLISLIGNATNLVGEVIGAVDGLLGSITQNGKTLNFLVDNLGNIVQEVVGGGADALHQIVGNFKLNMTEVEGTIKQVGQGLTQKTYSYEPLSALVDIITNAAGQVVSAIVQKKNGGGSGGGSGGGGSTTASASGTPMPVTLPLSSATAA
ncbi:hypothetical protein IAQ61_002432 [Plenodomus lingam]|uniref:Uncharacterized protein n=1 Tax=Leptosphaeria maculans (strain JN3 / isolate v23.1.3 / race Av1-4-5-6-7-8) TaxID=985895 RepID=E4ZIE1_LEPMJ|nr:hypothetical protein LEMA_P059960.1 [Plenodomus lingam JN3]KAH9877069.1 hypothetical protein IAQ61_002432 [Plenodomus lingam]CBX90962.1 hypothetical protein LEMA_P059960.1 [Plenodomus lingam JN3]